MAAERHVKLFKNGRNQAVRIPREFELPGDDALIRKEGDRLIIEPARPKSLLAVLATLRSIDEDFPPISDLAPNSVLTEEGDVSPQVLNSESALAVEAGSFSPLSRIIEGQRKG